MDFDCIVRGGTLVDGTGAPARAADLGIRAGRVAAIGALGADARDVIDATGCVVAPGFIDPHTHLDAQLCWDGSASPTNLHGVTTVVMGLCGFGVAPCPEDGGEYLLRSLEVVEEIPFECTRLGVPFRWRTLADYLGFLDTQPLAVNVASFVPHSALRFYVMGERARGEKASEAERAELLAELRRSLRAGAVGLASSRGPNHRDAFGDPVPSRFADDAELRALVGACRGRPWQINVETKFSADAGGLIAEVSKYEAWTRQAGARLSWTPFTADPGEDGWRRILAHNREANEQGIEVSPQVIAQPITVVFRFDRFSFVIAVPGWRDVLRGFFQLDPAERLARLADAKVREVLRRPPADPGARFAPNPDEWLLLRSRTRPELCGQSVAAAARRADARADPIDWLFDLVVADGLDTQVQVPAANRSCDGVDALVADPHTLLGLGDSGAHVTSINNYGYPTHLLATAVRDRGLLPLETAIHRMTAQPARFLGLRERGTLEPGSPADVTVFDLARLEALPVEIAGDLPGGASRLVQRARGYRAVLVNGIRTLEDDLPTGRAPGALAGGGAAPP